MEGRISSRSRSCRECCREEQLGVHNPNNNNNKKKSRFQKLREKVDVTEYLEQDCAIIFL